MPHPTPHSFNILLLLLVFNQQLPSVIILVHSPWQDSLSLIHPNFTFWSWFLDNGCHQAFFMEKFIGSYTTKKQYKYINKYFNWFICDCTKKKKLNIVKNSILITFSSTYFIYITSFWRVWLRSMTSICLSNTLHFANAYTWR